MNPLSNLKEWWNTPTKSEKDDPNWQLNRAQAIANIVTPLMAGVEAAASRGASPGTGTLMGVQQMNQSIEGLRQHSKDIKEQALKERMQKKEEELFPLQQEQLKSDLATKKLQQDEINRKAEQEKKWRESISQPSANLEEIAKKFASPSEVLDYIIKQKKSSEDPMTQWLKKEQIKEDMAIEKQRKLEEQKLAPLKRNVEALNKLADRVPASGRFGGLVENVKKIAGKEPIVKTYDDLFNATKGAIARNFGGEKGALSDQDIARIDGYKFSVYDTPEERDLKKSFWNVMTTSISDPSNILQALNDFDQKIIDIKTGNGQASTTQQNVKQDKYTKGQTITKNGKTYVYLGNDQWEEQ